MAVLPKRFAIFGLRLHPEKMRLVRFRPGMKRKLGEGCLPVGSVPATETANHVEPFIRVAKLLTEKPLGVVFPEGSVGVGSGNRPFYPTSVEAGVFLTGEGRPYNRAKGKWSRSPTPLLLYGPRTGPGAREVTTQFSHLDLTEAANAAGFSLLLGPVGSRATPQRASAEPDIVSLGINWHPVSHTKGMLNFVHANQKALGDANYIATRFQVDF